MGSQLKLLLAGSGLHLLIQAPYQIGALAFHEELQVLHATGILFLAANTRHTGTQTTFDVGVKTNTQSSPDALNGASSELKIPDSRLESPMRQACLEVGAEVKCTVFLDSPCDVDPGV